MHRRNGRLVLALIASALVGAGGGIALWQLRPVRTVAGGAPEQALARADDHEHDEQQLYTCGMHPHVVQRGPGHCPICGMALTPMKGSTAGGTKTITVDPVMVQNMGVRVATIKRGDLARSVRTIGEVVVAEDLVSVVNLKFSGWIDKLYVDQTGIRVRRGQALFRIYSPELVSAQEEYLLALRGAGKDSPLARSARTRLKLWDLTDGAIERIARRGKARRTLTVTAPRAGYVLHKGVVEGARALAGQDLFRIGKLSAIWVHTQVYEFDAPWIEVGQRATMELSFQRGKLYEGKVSYIYPTLNEATRTLTARLEFVNPQLKLKPGMFTTVRIKARTRTNVVQVPTEAIVHSGERQLVFVASHGPGGPSARGALIGRYEPREVVTGLAGDGHVTEVLSGLEEGDQVVVSGQFLLDSESQLQEALQKLMASRLQSIGENMPPRALPPATQSSQDNPDHSHDGAGETAWTCPMHARIAEDKPGSCPICGMDLVEKTAK